jgi:hypothetical protein
MSRTYDLAAFIQVPGAPDTPSMFANSGQGLTGVRKLGQRLILELLTPRGSMRFRPTAGTGLMTTIQQGRITNELDAHMYMQAALTEAETNLLDYELPEDPDDERYLRATIKDVAFEPGQLVYRIQLETLAGTDAEILVPVDTLPRGSA